MAASALMGHANFFQTFTDVNVVLLGAEFVHQHQNGLVRAIVASRLV